MAKIVRQVLLASQPKDAGVAVHHALPPVPYPTYESSSSGIQPRTGLREGANALTKRRVSAHNLVKADEVWVTGRLASLEFGSGVAPP